MYDCGDQDQAPSFLASLAMACRHPYRFSAKACEFAAESVYMCYHTYNATNITKQFPSTKLSVTTASLQPVSAKELDPDGVRGRNWGTLADEVRCSLQGDGDTRFRRGIWAVRASGIRRITSFFLPRPYDPLSEGTSKPSGKRPLHNRGRLPFACDSVVLSVSNKTLSQEPPLYLGL